MCWGQMNEVPPAEETLKEFGNYVAWVVEKDLIVLLIGTKI